MFEEDFIKIIASKAEECMTGCVPDLKAARACLEKLKAALKSDDVMYCSVLSNLEVVNYLLHPQPSSIKLLKSLIEPLEGNSKISIFDSFLEEKAQYSLRNAHLLFNVASMMFKCNLLDGSDAILKNLSIHISGESESFLLFKVVCLRFDILFRRYEMGFLGSHSFLEVIKELEHSYGYVADSIIRSTLSSTNSTDADFQRESQPVPVIQQLQSVSIRYRILLFSVRGNLVTRNLSVCSSKISELIAVHKDVAKLLRGLDESSSRLSNIDESRTTAVDLTVLSSSYSTDESASSAFKRSLDFNIEYESGMNLHYLSTWRLLHAGCLSIAHYGFLTSNYVLAMEYLTESSSLTTIYSLKYAESTFTATEPTIGMSNWITSINMNNRAVVELASGRHNIASLMLLKAISASGLKSTVSIASSTLIGHGRDNAEENDEEEHRDVTSKTLRAQVLATAAVSVSESSTTSSEKVASGVKNPCTFAADINCNATDSMRYNYGICLLKAHKPLEAFVYFYSTLKISKEKPYVWLRLAECCIAIDKDWRYSKDIAPLGVKSANVDERVAGNNASSNNDGLMDSSNFVRIMFSGRSRRIVFR
jgi:hypothetical protein